MKPEAYRLPNKTEICVRSPLPLLLASRRKTTGVGVAIALGCRRRATDGKTIRPWCEHCGTSHRSPAVAAECLRLLVNGPDWPDMGA